MNDKLLECLKLKKKDYVPIWFMRQAGRYLPEFQKIRKNNPNFINLCFNEKLVEEITLQPLKRYDLDAAIIFSDILLIPFGLGQQVRFEKNLGPILEDLNIEEIIKKDNKKFITKLSPIYKSIKNVKSKINQKSLIGFVGAPWTLLVYMLHKKSPKNDINIKNLLEDKIKVKNLLDKLVEIICVHIGEQVKAGANVIQLFDSWAGLLPREEISNYCFEPTIKIVDYVKSLNVPIICFPKGIKENYADFSLEVNPDCINIDYEIEPEWAKKNLENVVIQGGLDPKILLNGKEKIKKYVDRYLDIFADQPYIFNLGHGILPNTNPEIIDYVISIIKKK